MDNYVSTQSVQVKEQNRFLARVYGWMAIALLISAATAFSTAYYARINYTFARSLFGMGYLVLIIAELALVWWLSASIRKISTFAATIGFLSYSVLNGITLASIFFVYRLDSIVSIFGISALMFGAMAVYGANTKQNIMSFGRYFSMALIGILIASLVNLFLRSSGLTWLISIGTVILFTGLTAYDSQKMLRVSQMAQNTDVFKKASIIGALELYLDFINIFLSLLRLFGRRD